MLQKITEIFVGVGNEKPFFLIWKFRDQDLKLCIFHKYIKRKTQLIYKVGIFEPTRNLYYKNNSHLRKGLCNEQGDHVTGQQLINLNNRTSQKTRFIAPESFVPNDDDNMPLLYTNARKGAKFKTSKKHRINVLISAKLPFLRRRNW